MQRVLYSAFRKLICFAGVLTLVTRIGFAQQTTSEDWAFGYEAFNLLLQESEIEICDPRVWFSMPADEKIAIFIDPNLNENWSSAIRGVPTLVMSSRGGNFKARFRPALGTVAQNKPQDFYSSRDCPIVRPESTHEVFLGVDSLICNNPGYLADLPEQTISDKQFYPPTEMPHRGLNRQVFSTLVETPTRQMWVADPLLFSNQMLFKGDGLRFADNTLRWLSDDYRRKKALLIINGVEQSAVDPNDLEILTPIPTHDEVIQALKKLPRKEILEFANSVAQLSEDENILNDMAHKYTDGLQDGQVLRLIIFAIFISCLAFGLVTYFWQRRIGRRTSSVVTGRRQQSRSQREGNSEAAERQAAASLLLNAFCLEVAERRLADWPEFPVPIVSQDKHSNSPARQATNEMADAYWKLRTKPKSYWTNETLLDLELATHHWRQLISDNEITIETTPA